MILLIVVVVLIFGLGGGYWGHTQYGASNTFAGPGIGIGTILVILLLLFLFHII